MHETRPDPRRQLCLWNSRLAEELEISDEFQQDPSYLAQFFLVIKPLMVQSQLQLPMQGTNLAILYRNWGMAAGEGQVLLGAH